MDNLETIRARWDGVAWAYEAEQEGAYIANAILTNQLDQIVIDLDEPSEDERTWLQQCAAAPGDVQSLLAVIALLQAQLGGWAAQCAAQVDAIHQAVAVLRWLDIQGGLGQLKHEQIKAQIKALERVAESDAGSLRLLQRLAQADALVGTLREWVAHEVSGSALRVALVQYDAATKASGP